MSSDFPPFLKKFRQIRQNSGNLGEFGGIWGEFSEKFMAKRKIDDYSNEFHGNTGRHRLFCLSRPSQPFCPAGLTGPGTPAL
jgi:hypothetical protein